MGTASPARAGGDDWGIPSTPKGFVALLEDESSGSGTSWAKTVS
ncbi:MAG: hypothetical protein ACYDDF_05765 [Thermoplasmatota archaeon]